MNQIKSTISLAVVAAIVLTVVSGAIHGRSAKQSTLEQAYRNTELAFSNLPEKFGDWYLEDEHGLSDSALELLECGAFIHHSYRNRESGQVVNLAVMVGPGAKMSIHVPEICFEARNFRLIQERQPEQVDRDCFWHVGFQLNDVSERKLNVYYGWKVEDEWVAPKMPRWAVAGQPVLYKLQLSEHVSAAGQDEGGARDFLTHFLPLLNEQLDQVSVESNTQLASLHQIDAKEDEKALSAGQTDLD